MIAVIDYGLGNLASVANALKKLGVDYQVSSDPGVIKNAKALILPGVGAAGQGMKNLKQRDLDKIIIEEVKNGKPILGICLGMQLLFEESEEGKVECLGLIKGRIKKFKTQLKVPQIGWNEIEMRDDLPAGKAGRLKMRNILDGIKNKSYVYFVNSYICVPDDKSIIAATTNYDGDFCSILEKENIVGTQFHPEKSGKVGFNLLNNFIKYYAN